MKTNTQEIKCWAIKSRACIMDTIEPDGLTSIYKKTPEQVREEEPGAELMTLSAFCAWKADQQHTPITWAATTEAEYNEMLECLPPALWLVGLFLVGEPWDHDALTGQARYAAYYKKTGRYYKASRPLTRDEAFEIVRRGGALAEA